ncbi:MAG: hypothetical protein GY772_16605, partial [bacterium]|nr:hypothetical protein [bacterium]
MAADFTGSQGQGLPASRRPVSFSLHKYFASSQIGPQQETATQPEPPEGQSWKAKEREEQQSLEEAVAAVLDNQQLVAAEVEQVVVKKDRSYRGGRPRKPVGATKKGSYTALTGQQKVWLVSEFTERIRVPGTARRRLFEELAGQLGCTWASVRRIVQQK